MSGGGVPLRLDQFGEMVGESIENDIPKLHLSWNERHVGTPWGSPINSFLWMDSERSEQGRQMANWGPHP